MDRGFAPHGAEVMLLRAKLAEALRAWMERENLTQAKAAKRLGITQPRIPKSPAARSSCCLWIIWWDCAPRRAYLSAYGWRRKKLRFSVFLIRV